MNQNTLQKRELILQTAQKLIMIHGVKELSMQKLAKEAGVAAGIIYHYFKDKDELIQETRIYVTKAAADLVQSGIRDDMSLKEKYRTIWINIWNLSIKDISSKENMFREHGHEGTNTELIIREKHMFQKIDQFFEEGKQQGIFKSHNNSILASISLETSVNLAKKMHYDSLEVSQDDIDMVIETSWKMLLSDPESD